MDCKYNDGSADYFSNPRIKALFGKQKAKGLAKYGKTLEQHDNEQEHSEGHIINHLEEELADAVVYGRWLMSKQKGGTPQKAERVMALTRIIWQLNDALDTLNHKFPAKDYERE